MRSRRAESADDAAARTHTRRRNSGDERAAADGLPERAGPHFFSRARQLRQVDENEILERLTDRQEINAAHARHTITAGRRLDPLT